MLMKTMEEIKLLNIFKKIYSIDFILKIIIIIFLLQQDR